MGGLDSQGLLDLLRRLVPELFGDTPNGTVPAPQVPDQQGPGIGGLDQQFLRRLLEELLDGALGGIEPQAPDQQLPGVGGLDQQFLQRLLEELFGQLGPQSSGDVPGGSAALGTPDVLIGGTVS